MNNDRLWEHGNKESLNTCHPTAYGLQPKQPKSIQSNYIPWKGYFDIINQADLFT